VNRRPLRVCVIAFTHFATDARVRREAEALLDRGDSVDVLCLRDRSEYGGARPGLRLYGLWTPRYRGSSAVRYAAQYLAFFLLASAWAARLTLRRRYDVVHVHTMPDFVVFAALVPKLLGANVVLDIHDLMPELYASKFGLSPSHRGIRALRWLERRSVAFADCAIAVHEPHLDGLVGHGNPRERLRVVMNAPDPKLFAPRPQGQPAARGLSLVYHGTVAERHGLEVALRALALVRSEIVDLDFRLIGDGDDMDRVLHLVDELDLGDVVRVTRGFVPLEEIIPEIANADVGIVPILDDPFTRYMLPAKLLEYVALGIPVVCSETPAVRAYFDDSMIQFFTPGDSDDLARKLIDLHRSPARRRDLARAADGFNARFGWEAQRAAYYRVIDGLVAGSPPVAELQAEASHTD
jgi:glycosyltransferase involved in cell wall biosynthesis